MARFLGAIAIGTVMFGEVCKANEALGCIHILRDLRLAKWFRVESVVVRYPGEILKSLDASRNVWHAGFGTFFIEPDISELQRKRLAGAKNDWFGDIPFGVVPRISIAFLRNGSEMRHQMTSSAIGRRLKLCLGRPAPPAIEAGKGCQRQGAHNVSLATHGRGSQAKVTALIFDVCFAP
jgi:hypothetical protein